MFEQKNNNHSPTVTNAAEKLRSAVTFESMGRYESALMSLDEAIALQNDYVDAWLIKGVVLGKLGKCSEALQCYDKILQIDPQFADAWRLKAATYTSQNQYEKAAECFVKAVELNPQNMEFRISLARAYQKLKQTDQALQCYMEAKTLWPQDPRIDYYIGVMWGNLADYQKALAAFDDSLHLKPDFTEALLGKSIMLAKLGRKEEAKQLADKLLEENKGQAEKQKAAEAQSENNSIRNDFNAAQQKFKMKFASDSK